MYLYLRKNNLTKNNHTESATTHNHAKSAAGAAAADRGVRNIIRIKKLQMHALLLSGLIIMKLLSLRTKPSPPSLHTNPIMHINTQHAKSAAASVIDPPTRDEFDVATIRNYKFPSIQERFKYYMGSWADKTEWICSKDEIEVPPKPTSTSPKWKWNRLPQLISVNDLKVCADNTKTQNVYCRDAYYVLSQASEGMNDKTAGLFVFGDRNNRSDKPFIIKSRSALPLFDPKQSIPIMWPLKMKRHYGPVDQYKSQVKDVGKEIEWSSKKSILFWRGAFTGSRGITVANWLQHNVPVPDAVDVGFTERGGTHKMLDIKKDHPWAIKNATAIVDMQPYKYLLSLEGNDVASVSIVICRLVLYPILLLTRLVVLVPDKSGLEMDAVFQLRSVHADTH